MWAGFIIQMAILVFIVLNLVLGNKLLLCSNIFGYLSLIWFICLLFGRFDHYGKVCSGDFLAKGSKDEFAKMTKAGLFFKQYFQAIGLMVAAMFGCVLFYTCCYDSRVNADEDKKEQDKKD